MKEVRILFGKDDEKKPQKHEKKAWEFIDNKAKTEGLLAEAVKKAQKNKSTLGDAWEKLQLFFQLIKAYSNGDYRKVSKSTIVLVIGAVLYFVSPLDVVPDFIVGLGILDDAAVIGFTLKKITKELEEFKKWKN